VIEIQAEQMANAFRMSDQAPPPFAATQPHPCPRAALDARGMRGNYGMASKARSLCGRRASVRQEGVRGDRVMARSLKEVCVVLFSMTLARAVESTPLLQEIALAIRILIIEQCGASGCAHRGSFITCRRATSVLRLSRCVGLASCMRQDDKAGAGR
jgi:hypothetical protein